MKKLSIFAVVLSYIFTTSFSFAATVTTTDTAVKGASVSTSSSSKVDHFEITTNPASTKVNEAVDLTVKAVDKDGVVKKDYTGTIYITVDNDTKATVPYSDGYQFTAADLGQKTFSKGLIFTKEGKMKVIVMDIDNESLEGSIDVTVGAGLSSDNTGANGDLTITSPDNGVTITDNKISVTGTTKKNSKVKFLLNGKELTDLITQSDDSGAFSADITNLESTNIIEVKVLDGNDKIIAQSTKLSVSVENSGPVFKNLTITQGTEAPAGSEVDVTMLADPGLSEALVNIGDVSQPLTEDPKTPGSYVGKITIPSVSGDYSFDVALKNNLGKTTNKKQVAKIKATEANIFKNIKSVVSDKKVTFTFELTQDNDTYSKFKFKYGTSPDTLKTAGDTQIKESVTFEKAKIMTGSTYNWYIPGLDPAVGKYYFQLFALDKDGKEISGIQSDIVEVDFALSSAGNKCMISNVSGLKSKKVGDVMELSWDSLPEATSYNVYKKSSDGTFSLIENVTTNKYTLNMVGDKVKYDEFAIKAVCGDGETKAESSDYSQATKVQTGPTQVALFLGLSLIIGFFIVRRRFAK